MLIDLPKPQHLSVLAVDFQIPTAGLPAATLTAIKM